MAGSSDGEEENYWPGYVDALTTMTMVMTFIMMVLGVVVFTLSQNTAKNILVAVAKAAKIDAADLNGHDSKDLEKAVLQALAGRTQNDLPVPAKAPKPVEQPVPEAQVALAGAAIANDTTLTRVAPLPVPDDQKAPETRLLDDHTARDMTEHAKGGEIAQGEAPQGERQLRVVFRNGAVQIESDTANGITDYVRANKDAPGFLVLSLAVRGVAMSAGESATESRRRAYYRALLVRQQLLSAGIPAARIDVEVRDGTAADGSDTVKVIPSSTVVH